MSGRIHNRPIVLTAGGTGGHVFPADALAAELVVRGHAPVFVTDRRGEGYGGTLGQLPVYRIPAGGIAGRGAAARLGALLNLGMGFVKAYCLLTRLRPLAVVGFGGYASVPAMLAAPLAGIPTVLHEQNAVLGRANRLLANRVSRIATSLSSVQFMTPAWKNKAALTGMPVREAVVARRGDPFMAPAADGPIRLLVMGGSQGARILSEVVPAALAGLPEGLRARLSVSQQCRAEDIELAQGIYDGTGIDVTLASFFQDIPERLSSAHLVITRSGASSVAELTAMGRPSILVPYLHAIDDHQTANARAIDEAGAGWLMPQQSFTAEALRARLETLLTNPKTLSQAADCARAAGIPDAARRLADIVLSVVPSHTEAAP